jgi:hypothetical protein
MKGYFPVEGMFDSISDDAISQFADKLGDSDTARKAIRKLPMYPYYHVFHGVVTQVDHSYSGGFQNISLNCSDMLHFWNYHNISSNASVFGARPPGKNGLKMTFFYHNFVAMSPYEIIWTLHHDSAGAAGGVSFALSRKTNSAAVSEVGGESLFSLNVRYWEKRFSTKMYDLRLFGASGQVFSTIQAQFLGRLSRAEVNKVIGSRFPYNTHNTDSGKDRILNMAVSLQLLHTKKSWREGTTYNETPPAIAAFNYAESLGLISGRKVTIPTDEAVTDPNTGAVSIKTTNKKITTAVASNAMQLNMNNMIPFYHEVSQWGSVKLFESSYESKMDIAQKVCEVTQFEFYQDVDGDLVFKPPLYNIDTSSSRVYRIEDIDIISATYSEKEPTATYVTAKGGHFRNMALGSGLENEWGVQGQYIDYRLVAQFGWRPYSFETMYFTSARAMFFAGVNRLDRVNAGRTSANITIPIRPEMRPGYPIYIPYLDVHYYVVGFNHAYSAGGQCTTTLQCEAKRAKFFPPGDPNKTGIEAIDLKKTILPRRGLEVEGLDGKPRHVGLPNAVMALDTDTFNPLFWVVGFDVEDLAAQGSKVASRALGKMFLEIAKNEKFARVLGRGNADGSGELLVFKDATGQEFYITLNITNTETGVSPEGTQATGHSKYTVGRVYDSASLEKAVKDYVKGKESASTGAKNLQKKLKSVNGRISSLRRQMSKLPAYNADGTPNKAYEKARKKIEGDKHQNKYDRAWDALRDEVKALQEQIEKAQKLVAAADKKAAELYKGGTTQESRTQAYIWRIHRDNIRIHDGPLKAKAPTTYTQSDYEAAVELSKDFNGQKPKKESLQGMINLLSPGNNNGPVYKMIKLSGKTRTVTGVGYEQIRKDLTYSLRVLEREKDAQVRYSSNYSYIFHQVMNLTKQAWLQKEGNQVYGDVNSTYNLLEMLSDKKAIFNSGANLPGHYRYYSSAMPNKNDQGQAELQVPQVTRKSNGDLEVKYETLKKENKVVMTLVDGNGNPITKKCLQFVPSSQVTTEQENARKPEAQIIDNGEVSVGIRVAQNSKTQPHAFLATHEIKHIKFTPHDAESSRNILMPYVNPFRSFRVNTVRNAIRIKFGRVGSVGQTPKEAFETLWKDLWKDFKETLESVYPDTSAFPDLPEGDELLPRSINGPIGMSFIGKEEGGSAGPLTETLIGADGPNFPGTDKDDTYQTILYRRRGKKTVIDPDKTIADQAAEIKKAGDRWINKKRLLIKVRREIADNAFEMLNSITQSFYDELTWDLRFASESPSDHKNTNPDSKLQSEDVPYYYRRGVKRYQSTATQRAVRKRWDKDKKAQLIFKVWTKYLLAVRKVFSKRLGSPWPKARACHPTVNTDLDVIRVRVEKVKKKTSTYSPVFPVSDAKGYEVIGTYQYGRDLNILPTGNWAQMIQQDWALGLDEDTRNEFLSVLEEGGGNIFSIKGSGKNITIDPGFDLTNFAEYQNITKMIQSSSGSQSDKDKIEAARQALGGDADKRSSVVLDKMLTQLVAQRPYDKTLLNFDQIGTGGRTARFYIGLANYIATTNDAPMKLPAVNGSYSLASLANAVDKGVCTCRGADADNYMLAFSQDFVGLSALSEMSEDVKGQYGTDAISRATTWQATQIASRIQDWKDRQKLYRGQQMDKDTSQLDEIIEGANKGPGEDLFDFWREDSESRSDALDGWEDRTKALKEKAETEWAKAGVALTNTDERKGPAYTPDPSNPGYNLNGVWMGQEDRDNPGFDYNGNKLGPNT